MNKTELVQKVKGVPAYVKEHWELVLREISRAIRESPLQPTRRMLI